MKTDTNIFPEVIGQEPAKKKLGFFINGYKRTSILPHLMFVAPKGCGKTMISKAVGKLLTGPDGGTKPFLEVNCSTIRNLKQFFNNFLIPHVNDRDCTVLLDECSELPRDVEMALLTILNPNKQNRTSFSYEDFTIDFDFKRVSFIFATTEAQKVFHALMDRCERVDLKDYSYEELGKIVQILMPDTKFPENLLTEIATVLRGNPRQAQKMATNMTGHLAGTGDTKDFNRKVWDDLKAQLGIHPLGLNDKEIEVLQHIEQGGTLTLTNLSARTGLSKECLQRDYEMWLLKMGLMQIATTGRQLTARGVSYLDKMNLPPLEGMGHWTAKVKKRKEKAKKKTVKSKKIDTK
jgi:Holliday junction resolvasome RuvABC ATP-dependent DNA helicase subunit